MWSWQRAQPDGEAQPDGAGGLDPIDRIFQKIFVGDGAAFVAGHVVSMEPTGDQLFDGRIRQKIARELFDGESIERHVLAEGVEDPVAIGPDLAAGIHVDAAGVGEASEVEPGRRHPFGEAGAIRLLGEQAIDEAFVGIVAGRRGSRRVRRGSVEGR